MTRSWHRMPPRSRLLAAHEPFPALELDAYSVVVAANRACSPLFGGGLVATNMVEFYLDNPASRDAIVNWPEVAYAALARLHRQRDRAALDERMQDQVDLAESAVADLPKPLDTGPDSLVVCPWFRVGDRIVRTSFGRFNDDVGVDVTVQTTNECPPETVAAFAGNPTNAPRWYANIRSVDWQTPPPVAAGSRMDSVAQFVGRQLS